MTSDSSLEHAVREDVPPEPWPWRDNAFVAFWSPGSDVVGVVHLSTSPNAEGRRARASLSVRGVTAEIVEPLDAGSFESESVRFDLAGRVEVDHPSMKLTAEFKPRFALGDFSDTGVIPPLVEDQPLRHLQQGTDVTGAAAVFRRGREERVEFTAVGMRDRTWGFRDETAAFVEYVAVTLDLGDALVTAMKFLAPDGSQTMHGFRLADRATPVHSLQLTRDAAGLVVGLELGLAESAPLELRRDAQLGGFWVPMGIERTGPVFSAYDEFLTLRGGGAGFVEQGVRRNLW